MPASGDESVVVLHVREGEIVDAGSWVYAWLRVDGDRRVVYVGATGLPPQTRTWLHLHDPDPNVGRIAARHPAVAEEPLDVVALRLHDDVSRQDVKAAVTARLSEEGLLSDSYVGDRPLDDAAAAPEDAPYVERLVTLVRQHCSFEPEQV